MAFINRCSKWYISFDKLVNEMMVLVLKFVLNIDIGGHELIDHIFYLFCGLHS